MKRFAKIIPYILIAIFVISCATVPISGRKQLNIIPDSQILSMSFQQYDSFLKENRPSGNNAEAMMVKKVGRSIQRAVEKYFADKGMAQVLNGYQWEFNLVDQDQVNAWCMPGGKVVVYTGLLPVAQDETGLAVVMGHEIAHAVAKHGSERMSQGLIAQMGGIALSKALEEKPDSTKLLWTTVFGLGTQFGIMLPYSRMHESEADHLGLIFMAMAGYDPRKAVQFWERMASQKGGKTPPEFLSTHPSDRTRIKDIEELIPDAMTYYNQTRN